MIMDSNFKKNEILWRLKRLQSGISQNSHKYRTSGIQSSGHCCWVCHIAAHRLRFICTCWSLSPWHCRGGRGGTCFNHQKHKSDEASWRGLDTAQFTGRTKDSVVYPSDSLKTMLWCIPGRGQTWECVWPCRGERLADALRVCHSNSPVSGAVRHSYKEAALTKPLATTELDCCVRVQDSEAVVCLLTQHLPINAEALQNLYFLGLMLWFPLL